MKNYAQIGAGLVVSLIPGILADIDMMEPDGEGGLVLTVPAGQEIPIEMRYHCDFVATLVAIPDGVEVSLGDSYDGKRFGAPPPAPSMTAEQALALRTGMRSEADAAIVPLQDALELEVITPAEQALLTKWRKYRVDLSRIEQQTGFPAKVVWPAKPA